jgi:hypothetical protein
MCIKNLKRGFHITPRTPQACTCNYTYTHICIVHCTLAYLIHFAVTSDSSDASTTFPFTESTTTVLDTTTTTVPDTTTAPKDLCKYDKNNKLIINAVKD